MKATGATTPPETRELVPATSEPGKMVPSTESVLLQKLLAELVAREVALIRQPYLVEPRRHTALMRTLWSSLWALSIVLCVFVVKYLDSQQTAVTIHAAQTQSIDHLTDTMDAQKAEFSKVTESIRGLEDVIASTSERTAAVPAMLKRLAGDLRQTTPLPVAEAGVPAREPAREATTPALMMPPPQGDAAEISLGGHHHAPMEYSVAPADVAVHHNYLGAIDYWLMPRVVSGVWTATKVVPIAESPSGILVHDVAEVRDYIVTPSREWIATSDATTTTSPTK